MQRKTYSMLLLLVLGLLALRLWHIRADFPDFHFYSQEGAQFTDEGFYTGAAISHFTLGHAYLPGGWNPGVFMPVWPLMVGLLFHFTGVSVVAARSLAVVCTWLSVLLAYGIGRQYRSQTFAWVTALLLSVNAFAFFYSRLAILEPPFVMFLLLAIYLAGRVKPGTYLLAAAVGVVFVVLTLTKTTGPFVLPAVLYPIWAGSRKDRAEAWKLVVAAFAPAVLLLFAAKLVWFYHYSSDAQLILGLNPLWQLENAPPRLVRFFLRGTWVDPVLFPLALAAFIGATWRLRFLWKDTLFTTAFLWEAGYAAFIVFHYDGPPRYFVALIVPTIWLALIFTEWLWQAQRTVAIVVMGAIIVSVVWNLAFIGLYLAHPQYSMVNASMNVRRVIEAGSATGSNPLLIGRGADEISLLSNGLPAIDSDGVMPLAEKLDVYRPGWLMVWSRDVPLRKATVAEKRRLVVRGVLPGVDRSHDAGITLYQLFPKQAK